VLTNLYESIRDNRLGFFFGDLENSDFSDLFRVRSPTTDCIRNIVSYHINTKITRDAIYAKIERAVILAICSDCTMYFFAPSHVDCWVYMDAQGMPVIVSQKKFSAIDELGPNKAA
jgi:hypothetical protein